MEVVYLIPTKYSMHLKPPHCTGLMNEKNCMYTCVRERAKRERGTDVLSTCGILQGEVSR